MQCNEARWGWVGGHAVDALPQTTLTSDPAPDEAGVSELEIGLVVDAAYLVEIVPSSAPSCTSSLSPACRSMPLIELGSLSVVIKRLSDLNGQSNLVVVSPTMLMSELGTGIVMALVVACFWPSGGARATAASQDGAARATVL